MKTFTSSLIALLFSLTGFAQDWAPYVPGQVSYYDNGYGKLLRKVDTFFHRSDYTVHYYQSPFAPCAMDTTKYIRPLDSLIIRSDTFTYYYSDAVKNPEAYPEARQDSINFFFAKPLGYSWEKVRYSHPYFADSTIITFTIDSLYQGNFLGLTDSIKRIKVFLEHKELFMHVSKNHGIIKGPLMPPIVEGLDFEHYTIPYREPAQLVGLKNDSLNLGYQFPKVKDFFGLSPGDIIKWRKSYTFTTSSTYYNEVFHVMDSIVSIWMTDSNITYAYKRWVVVNATPNDSIKTLYDSTTTSFTPWRKRLDANSMAIATFAPLFQERIYSYNVGWSGVFNLPSFPVRTLTDGIFSCNTSHYPLGVDTLHAYEEQTITLDLGLTSFGNGYISYSNETLESWRTTMIGYKTAGGTYGDVSPIVVGLNTRDKTSFNIFPNPSSSEITINLPRQVLFDGVLTIQDLTGRTAFHTPLNGQTTWSVDHFQPGLYLLTVTTEEARYQAKLLIQ